MINMWPQLKFFSPLPPAVLGLLRPCIEIIATLINVKAGFTIRTFGKGRP